jgi:hypothetical protein
MAAKCVSLIYLLGIGLILVSCTYSDSNCSIRKFNFANEIYTAKGCLNNNVEEGEWFFYNEKSQIVERGFYDNGLKTGKWYYPSNKADSVIIWKKYNKKDLKLIFSIPALLEVVEDSSEYIKFSNQDSSKLFNILLSVHDIGQTQKTIENYYKQGEEEIEAQGWQFTASRNKVITPNRTLYFSEYSVVVSGSKSFKILNAYSLVSRNKIFEISCRYDITTEASARLIYFSLLTNVFLF